MPPLQSFTCQKKKRKRSVRQTQVSSCAAAVLATTHPTAAAVRSTIAMACRRQRDIRLVIRPAAAGGRRSNRGALSHPACRCVDRSRLREDHRPRRLLPLDIRGSTIYLIVRVVYLQILRPIFVQKNDAAAVAEGDLCRHRCTNKSPGAQLLFGLQQYIRHRAGILWIDVVVVVARDRVHDQRRLSPRIGSRSSAAGGRGSRRRTSGASRCCGTAVRYFRYRCEEHFRRRLPLRFSTRRCRRDRCKCPRLPRYGCATVRQKSSRLFQQLQKKMNVVGAANQTKNSVEKCRKKKNKLNSTRAVQERDSAGHDIA